MRKIIFTLLLIIAFAYPVDWRLWSSPNDYYFNTAFIVPFWKNSPVGVGIGMELWFAGKYGFGSGLYGSFPTRFDLFKGLSVNFEGSYGFGYKGKLNYARTELAYWFGLKLPPVYICCNSCKINMTIDVGYLYMLIRYMDNFYAWQEDKLNWFVGLQIKL